MTVNSELKSWLERPQLSIIASLELAIKVWNSVEFVYTSKYDVIVEHFSQLVSSPLPSDVSREDFLRVVKEFVNLSFPIGVLSQKSKKSLVNAVLTIPTDPNDTRSHMEILRSLQLHTRMASLFNSNHSLYGKIVSRLFDLHLILLNQNDHVTLVHIKEIKKHFGDVKTFCQYNQSAASFEEIFARDFMPSLTNVVVKCQSTEYPVEAEYFSILEMIFFNAEKTSQLKEYLKTYPKGEIEFFKLFPNDSVLLTFLDALVANYHTDKEFMKLFLHCVCEKVPSEYNKQEILFIRHSFFLLRKYDVKLILSTTHEMMSTLSTNMVAKASKNFPVLVLDLICQAIQWNPIVQDEILVLIVHFMTVEKDEETLLKYAELIQRAMSTFSRLNRFEKKTSKLFELVKQETENLKATQVMQKLKRKGEKINSETVASSGKKKKRNDSSTVIESEEKSSNEDQLNLNLIEKSYNKDKLSTDSHWDETWTNLSNIWPRSVSLTWGQVVSGLVTKPSMMLWKSILITLTEALSNAASRSYDEQSVVFIKFLCCFLCEYLTATRILEQTDQQFEAIEEMCEQTKNVLKSFGGQILETEHNTELVSAFLSVAIKCGAFETSLLYYHPDSIGEENANDEEKPAKPKQLNFDQKGRGVFEFLTADEWSLIEQRVINFGKENCRARLTDLNYRKVKAIQLGDPSFVSREMKTWNKAIITDFNLLIKFVENCISLEEFLGELTRKQKITMVRTIFDANDGAVTEEKEKFVRMISEQYELVELSSLAILRIISETHLPEESALRSVDFKSMMESQELELPEVKDLLAKSGKKRKITEKEELIKKIKLIHSLPLGYLKEQDKSIIFTLHALLIHDLTGHEELSAAALENIRLMRELGHRFDSLKHLDLMTQLEIFTSRSGRAIVMDSVGNYFGDTQLKQVKALLKKMAKEEEDFKDLILLTTERFSMTKRNHKNEKTLAIYKTKLSKLVFDLYEKDEEPKDAGVLLCALNLHLNNKESLTESNGTLGKTCLKVASQRPLEDDEANEMHKAQILFHCFQNRVHFELELKDLEPLLDVYWNKIKSIRDPDMITAKNILTLMSVFDLHASTERYIALLSEIAEMAEKEEEIGNLRIICRHLQNLCPFPVNNAKGTALSEFLKKTLDIVIIKLTLRDGNVYEHSELILDILKCFSVAALNRQIVMSQSLFANILSFSLDLNIKRFKLTETNATIFTRLHEQLSEMCTNLIQARSLALVNAMPQLVSLLKDLIHTICAFRNDRNEAKQKLSEGEVNMLSNLAHRLEPILNGFADKDHLGRKVAPYLLVYVINEMIFNPNSTTLYPAIKLAINNVCYKLIGICDAKYSQFILRSCSEASGDVYKTLVKEYENYYKFQGKV